MYIHSTGCFYPENIIDNSFLEKLDIGTSDAWIQERVGIRERRTVLPLGYILETRNADPREAHAASLYSNAETGARAAEAALLRAGLKKEALGMIIAGGCSPQHMIPAEACTIAARMDLDVPAFDINSACSSFAAQIYQLSRMRPETLPDYILIVNAENNTRVVDYRDRSTAVLWGDCTTATILSPLIPGRLKVAASVLSSGPKGWRHVRIPPGGHFTQNGATVQTFAVRKTMQTLRTLEDLAPSLEEGQQKPQPWFIGHQANMLMLKSVCQHMSIPEERHLFNVPRYGNCGAAGAPSVLSQNLDMLSPGDQIHLVVVGSGLTWGGLTLTSEGSF